MLTLSAWASKREGWKSPFRDDSLLSTTIMHAVKGILTAGYEVEMISVKIE